MKKKVTMRELVGARIVLAACIAVYYWCWARNDWHSYYPTITNTVWIFAFWFYVFLSLREKRYKKEVADELVVANLRRCDAICLKISLIAMVCIAFLCAIVRFTVTTEVIGYLLMGLLVCLSVIRTILFSIMDAKGV
ncbi:MAG: DUF3796 domain-containing protein [Oscillospiraceae bacterium]|nr:DUF3796 domain-containing protein [Oscillospiraceae bacterium]